MAVTLSADEAREILRERGHDASEVVPLSGGMWSATFAFREGAREYVVRFHDRRDDLEKDRFAWRWASDRLRVPHMVEISDFGTGGLGISERVHGREIDGLDAAGMRTILPALLTALDATRDADLRGTRGFGLWHGDGNAPYASWHEALRAGMPERRARLARTSIGTGEFDLGLGRLEELLGACGNERQLVHNDLLYHNVFADDAGVVLLDWGASIYGDFLYDAALLTFWWPHPYYAKWASIDIRSEIERHHASLGLEIPRFAERLRACELSIGLEHIVSQAEQGDPVNATWTARRTRERAQAPL